MQSQNQDLWRNLLLTKVLLVDVVQVMLSNRWTLSGQHHRPRLLKTRLTKQKQAKRVTFFSLKEHEKNKAPFFSFEWVFWGKDDKHPR